MIDDFQAKKNTFRYTNLLLRPNLEKKYSAHFCDLESVSAEKTMTIHSYCTKHNKHGKFN